MEKRVVWSVQKHQYYLKGGVSKRRVRQKQFLNYPVYWTLYPTHLSLSNIIVTSLLPPNKSWSIFPSCVQLNYVVNPVLLLLLPQQKERKMCTGRASLWLACFSAKRVGRGLWNGFMCGDKCNFNWWRLMIVHSEYRWWAHCCVAWRLSEFSKLIHSGHHHITGKTWAKLMVHSSKCLWAEVTKVT